MKNEELALFIHHMLKIIINNNNSAQVNVKETCSVSVFSGSGPQGPSHKVRLIMF